MKTKKIKKSEVLSTNYMFKYISAIYKELISMEEAQITKLNFPFYVFTFFKTKLGNSKGTDIKFLQFLTTLKKN